MFKIFVVSSVGAIGLSAWAGSAPNPSAVFEHTANVAAPIQFADYMPYVATIPVVETTLPSVPTVPIPPPQEDFEAVEPVEVERKELMVKLESIEASTVTPVTQVAQLASVANAKCPEWHDLARSIGWDDQNIARLDLIMWRESRCDSSVHNKLDPASGSRGLIQINGYWCRKSQYTSSPGGWLQDQGVLTSCDDLFDPATNLRAGLAIFNYSDERGCAWRPWTTRKTNWCG